MLVQVDDKKLARDAPPKGRTLIASALASAGDLEVIDTELRVTLAARSSPHRTRAIASFCEELDDTETRFPGTELRLRFAIREGPGVIRLVG